MGSVVEEGRTVEEAIEKGLERLGAKREDAKIEVIEEGTKGLFGFGARPAKVKISLQGENASGEATKILEEILTLMGMPVQVSACEEEGRICLEAKGESTGLLIGRRGATLDALQFLVGLILSRRWGRQIRVVVDAEGYRGRRRRTLIDLAQRMANQVRLSGEEINLGPMNAYERHIIHSTLQYHRDVKTISAGEGSERQVVILPRAKEDPLA